MNNLSEQFEAQQRSKESARRNSRLGNLNLKVIGLIASAAIILVIIVVVAILVIGPKDFPVVLRKIGNWMGSLKRYFSEF